MAHTKDRSWQLVFAVIIALIILGSFLYFHSARISFHISEPIVRHNEATMIFVGDIMLSRNIGQLIVKNNDWSYPFENIKEVLNSADLTFANFENPVSTRGTLSGSIYSFRVDPRALKGMTDSGFDVVSIANNHIWDYGRDAFNDTLQLLNDNGISPVGGAADFTTAHTPVVKDVNGTKVAFLAYTRLVPNFLSNVDSKPSVAYPDPLQISKDVAGAKSLADIVVVSFHWGEEYETTHNEEQERLGHAAIDAGADLVVGHHPHVVEEVEKYNDKYIAYSLGNFVFDQNFSEDTAHGLMLKVTLEDKGISRVEEVPVSFNKNYQPSI